MCLSMYNKILKPLNTSGIDREAAKVSTFAVNSQKGWHCRQVSHKCKLNIISLD